MQPPAARRVVALYLALFGYFGDVYAATVLMNSNAIKNLPGGALGGKIPDTVSPSPRTSPPGNPGHKAAADTSQTGVCTDDEECGGDEFCNDVRGVCLPCRKNRKRCGRDSMCCSGSRCINGICQANEVEGGEVVIVSSPHRHNSNNHTAANTKRPSAPHNHQPHSAKGQEGDTCLRSADCSEGLCCARHFWSRICKPVLTEGQVCTRHRRKGAHGLELFQRCDCGDGLACRPEKGEQREHGVSRTVARNLHTCQRR